MHGTETDGDPLEPITHGYLIAIETMGGMNPVELKRVLDAMIPELSDFITKVDVEYLGSIDVYDAEDAKREES